MPRRRSGYHRRSASVRLNELQECETEKIGALLFSGIEDNSSVCLQLHRVSKHRCVNNAPALRFMNKILGGTQSWQSTVALTNGTQWRRSIVPVVPLFANYFRDCSIALSELSQERFCQHYRLVLRMFCCRCSLRLFV